MSQKLLGDTDVVVAQMDASANDAVGIEPEGFPTILFYPKTNKRGIEYAMAYCAIVAALQADFPLRPLQI